MSESPQGRSSHSHRPGNTRVGQDDARYPPELNDLQQNAPPFLWSRGSLAVLDVKPRVAIVGTRRATPYGQRIAREITSALARAGACIVSGLATGIDGIAHRTALEHDARTIAVLGTGLDVAFPVGHRALQNTIAERGLLLTELESTEHGWKSTFPQRNRIIAALSLLTIVVEAPVTSGAMGTAHWAAEIGRDVAAVPGPIDEPRSAGCHRLIKDGAHIITSVEDALALARLTMPVRSPRLDPEGDEGRVWAALAEACPSLDMLCHRSGLPAPQCMAAVTKLEIDGYIECALTGEIRRR